jgi:hypothetical protein
MKHLSSNSLVMIALLAEASNRLQRVICPEGSLSAEKYGKIPIV